MGYNGYEAGHAERRVAEVLQHFKAVSERLRTDLERLPGYGSSSVATM